MDSVRINYLTQCKSWTMDSVGINDPTQCKSWTMDSVRINDPTQCKSWTMDSVGINDLTQCMSWTMDSVRINDLTQCKSWAVDSVRINDLTQCKSWTMDSVRINDLTQCKSWTMDNVRINDLTQCKSWAVDMCSLWQVVSPHTQSAGDSHTAGSGDWGSTFHHQVWRARHFVCTGRLIDIPVLVGGEGGGGVTEPRLKVWTKQNYALGKAHIHIYALHPVSRKIALCCHTEFLSRNNDLTSHPSSNTP